MIISIIRPVQLVSSVGVVETTTTHSACDGTVSFNQGTLRNDGFNVFERTGPDLFIEDYDLAKAPTYQINDIHMHPDGCIKYVSEIGGTTVAKQPEEYLPEPPETLGFGSWSHRYAKLGVLSGNVWSKVTNGVTHSLRTEDGKWYYKISKQIPESYWGPEEYVHTSSNWAFFRLVGGGSIITPGPLAIYDNNTLAAVGPAQPNDNLPLGTIITGSLGYTYKSGRLRYHFVAELGDSWGKYYSFYRKLTRFITQSTEVEVTMMSESNLSINEEKAYCYNSSNCANEWFPKVIIRRGDTLYIRTDTDDSQETKVIGAPEFANLERLDQIPWGWTMIRPTAQYAPLDKIRYTYVEAPSPVEYTVKSDYPFDTVAINGLIASDLEVTFLPSDGSDAIPMIPVDITTNRDKDSRLPKYQTTVVGYAPRDIVGSVHIKFINDGNVRIGGIALGLSVDAGFTNLVFSNKFQDYSPYEKDQFGNIMYVEGVKTNIYAGTVDVELTDYDMMNRLMASIGGKTVILDGSDNLNNEHPDNENFFASTALVGRIRNFTLRTKLDNKKMSQMATYSFEIEEDV